MDIDFFEIGNIFKLAQKSELGARHVQTHLNEDCIPSKHAHSPSSSKSNTSEDCI